MKRATLLVAMGVTAAMPARAAVFEVAPDGTVAERAVRGEVVGQRPTAAEPAPDVPEAAVTTIADPIVPVAYQAAFRKSAELYRLSPALLAAVVGRESAWRAGAVSPKGARGLAQLMPATARMLSVDPLDPAANLVGGAHYLRAMLDRFDGDVERALAAYNAGPGRVLRAGGIPAIAETQAYVSTILARLAPDLSALQPGAVR